MSPGDKLERTMDEYRSTLTEVIQNQEAKDDLHWELVQRKLSSISSWTNEGAEVITRLAREYGWFMLCNALAVANVLDVEDGDLGY